MAGELERRPGPGALPDPDSVVIPDDASGLEPDYWALQAERAAARQRAAQAGARAAAAGAAPSSAPSTAGQLAARLGPMLMGLLILVAFLASLGFMVRPMSQPATPPAGLASSAQGVGSIGGLLPAGLVSVNGSTLSLRDVRPAVIVWLPAAGADQALLDSLYLQASSYGLPLVLAGPSQRRQELVDAADETGPGHVSVLVERGTLLLDGLGLPATAGPVVAVVGKDGRLHAVLDDPAPGTRLESVLSRVAAGSAPVA